MISIIKEIEKRTKEHPDKLLFAFLDIKGNIKESYTYAEFEQHCKNIAAHIHNNYTFSVGDRVLLAYPPGLEMIKAFFACVRLGLIPVPVYPPAAQGLEASVQKMNFIAQDSGAKAVLTDRSCYWSYKVNLSRNETGVSALQWIVSEETDTTNTPPLPEFYSEILFLQYTSGSTNDPKGVMVTHANIIQNCINTVDHLPVGISWLPQYHDMGLIGYYLFFALKGGTTYGFSPSDFIQRPALWLEAISKFKATASSAPNFAFEYVMEPGKIPDNILASLDLSSLCFFMTASEPIRPATYFSFLEKFKSNGLQPTGFFGAYGLAEYTLCVTNHGRRSLLLDSTELKQNRAKILHTAHEKSVSVMSCGIPLGDTQIKIVDTQTGNNKVSDGQIGEIFLNGSCKCKAYWNRPELSKQIFEAKITGENGEWLRTGDLGFIHEGELFVCGRVKDMIIIRGLNYYPHDIEAIVEKDLLLRKGSSVAFAIENEGTEKLIIVAGVKSPSSLPDARVIQQNVQQYLGISVSEIVFVPARTISKTSSGKLKRFETREKYLRNGLQIVSRAVFDEKEEMPQVSNDMAEKNSGYHLLFHRYNLNGMESAALGDAGLDSIKIAEFGHDLKTLLEKKGFDDLSHEVDLKLLQRIAVSELFAILKDLDSASSLARFKFRRAFMAINAEYEKSETELMVRDAVLPRTKEIANTQHNTGRDIFLTGGTGFLGPFLVKSLLEQTKDTIHVLVRANSLTEGMERLRTAFNYVNPSEELAISFQNRVKPLCGDLSKQKLGVNNKTWDFLSGNIHTIFHNGACVNYIMDYELMREANVNGTKRIIELAQRSIHKTVNYISTTFIFGWSVKETLWEIDSNPKMEFLDFGYSQTKWVADQLLQKAIQQGLKGRVFRPALISPSINGEGYNFDISIRLLVFMLKHGIGTSALNQVSFTPADIVANNIVAISGINTSVGKTFHVTRDEYANMQDVTERLGALANQSFRNFDLKAFVPEIVSRCEKKDLLFPLLNFLVKSVDNISAMEFKRYDNSNYQQFRAQSPYGKADPPLDEVVNGIFLFMKQNKEIAENLMKESLASH